MADEHLKAIPSSESGLLTFQMDRAGYELFERLLKRAVPGKADNAGVFKQAKDRVDGAFFAGASQMGWLRK
ncbi:hypothetical protein RA19_00285 [Leisingera sp. ANG-M1]|uniref:hypothetical protein n=1 Tax=Leisingera sp. ANG-M1 TaxID=1577895 RepID=UPI00057D1C11|nr:hypothetical protein [Leisingera sp. ANG-M1]KIC12879.1 hypothetical protein RA19_00285 [Leisingera sp. ANG-M1]